MAFREEFGAEYIPQQFYSAQRNYVEHDNMPTFRTRNACELIKRPFYTVKNPSTKLNPGLHEDFVNMLYEKITVDCTQNDNITLNGLKSALIIVIKSRSTAVPFNLDNILNIANSFSGNELFIVTEYAVTVFTHLNFCLSKKYLNKVTVRHTEAVEKMTRHPKLFYKNEPHSVYCVSQTDDFIGRIGFIDYEYSLKMYFDNVSNTFTETLDSAQVFSTNCKHVHKNNEKTTIKFSGSIAYSKDAHLQTTPERVKNYRRSHDDVLESRPVSLDPDGKKRWEANVQYLSEFTVAPASGQFAESNGQPSIIVQASDEGANYRTHSGINSHAYLSFGQYSFGPTIPRIRANQDTLPSVSTY